MVQKQSQQSGFELRNKSILKKILFVNIVGNLPSSIASNGPSICLKNHVNMALFHDVLNIDIQCTLIYESL